MKVNFNTPEEFHRKLGLVFNASIALPLLPFVWIYLEMAKNNFQGVWSNSIMGLIGGYVVPVLAGLMALQGFQIYKGVKSVEASTLKEKLLSFYSYAFRLYLWVGMAAAFMAVGLYLTTEGMLIVSYVILLFVMSFFRPTPKRYVKDLKLAGDEKDIIFNQKDKQL